MTDDARRRGLEDWGRQALAARGQALPAGRHLRAISGDASFRRYFRFAAGADGYVLVDAPPQQEDSQAFIRVAAGLRARGLRCPEALAVDLGRGYLLVTDLGDARFLEVIQQSPERAGPLYDKALETLARLRGARAECLPDYGRPALTREMQLFDDWYLGRYLGMPRSDRQAAALAETKAALLANAAAQPQVFVHRDYHSRNLMALADGELGLLDFQDAVIGPLTYDLVSLLKDCYHRLPRDEVEARVDWYRRRTAAAVGQADFLKWFDLMGAQRHLKCAGIFARLCLRDGKPAYLQDLPLVLDYLHEVCALYGELAPLGRLLADLPSPAAGSQGAASR